MLTVIKNGIFLLGFVLYCHIVWLYSVLFEKILGPCVPSDVVYVVDFHLFISSLASKNDFVGICIIVFGCIVCSF